MKVRSIIIAVLAILFLLALTVLVAAPVESRSAATSSARVQSAERLVIRYSDAGFELISRTPVQKVLPPSMTLPESPENKGVRGTWFEVRDDAGNTVYRRPMESPQVLRVETLSDDGKTIEHAEVTQSETVFSVLVPVTAATKSLVVFDMVRDAQKRIVSDTATELGRLDLK